MKKEFALKYISIVEDIYNKLDEGKSVETSQLVQFTAEFWNSVCPSIMNYASATPEVRQKTRKLLENQKQVVKGLK